MYYRPFNYRYDGVFARASKAWFVRDDGSISEVQVDERRLRPRGTPAVDWIFMEGARENFITAPLDLENVAWDSPASSSSTPPVERPDGFGGPVADVADFDDINQTFLAGSNGALVTWSVYVIATTGSSASLWIENGVPSTSGATPTNEFIWTRAMRKAVSLSAGGNKLAHLTVNDQSWASLACVEAGPAYAQSAYFASQPILEKIVRQAEDFNVGAVHPDWLTVNGGCTGFRVSFEPDFASADVQDPDAFILVWFDTGAPATSVMLALEGTGPGAVRVRLGFGTGAFVASGSITFSAGQRLDLIASIDGGGVNVAGATTGNGFFPTATPFPLVAGAAVRIGGASTVSAYGLVGPMELTFAGFAFGTFEQLTLNSARLTFEDYLGPVDVLQFNPRGQNDALNPANYEITGSPGLPRVQYVQPGETGSEVVLFFDGNLTPGSTVRVSPSNIVLAGNVPVTIEQGAGATLDLFPQTAGRLDTVFEVVRRGEAGDGAVLETFFLNGLPPPAEAIGGVVIFDANPEAPYVYYYFDTGDTSLDMETSITAVAGHLIRVKIPGTPIPLSALDENVYPFSNGQSPPVLSFIAFGAEQNAVTAALATYPRVDIANPQTERDTPQGATLGTFQVTDTGDLENDHGRPYLRKRIFRRLQTIKGAFFHMANYGLLPPSKKLFTPTTIRRLKIDIEMQVRQEPGVVGVRATVTELRPGVVKVVLRVQDDNGSFELEGALDFTAE